jgi:preprotein translocase subunit SecG
MNLILILIAVVSIILVLFVLVQNPKGGGLNSEFGSTGQLGGAKRATDILEKGTWGLAIGLALLCLVMAPYYLGDGDGTVEEGENIEINASSENATSDLAE